MTALGAISHVGPSAPAASTETTIGVTGLRPRWSVTLWGSVLPWDVPTRDGRAAALDWFVAADDRWHIPSQEPTVRQQRLEGTPVIETRVRIPDGDAVQRVWAVPDRGGMVIVEFENESPLPFAVAVSGLDVITEREPSTAPVQGIDLPTDALVLPVGHHATIRVAVPVTQAPASTPQSDAAIDGSPSRSPGGTVTRARAGLPRISPVLSVVRGWTRVVEQASRLVLPDAALVEAVVAARCDLLLEGPVDRGDDPAGFVLDVAELVRCGDSADAWLVEIVEPTEHIARAGARIEPEHLADALLAARLIATHAADDRATADIDRLVDRVAGRVSGRRRKRGDSRARSRGASGTTGGGRMTAPSSFAEVRRAASVGRFVRSIERRLANDGALLPGGVPTAWLGSNFEVHGVPTGPGSTISYAVRWHGERPAVLWEQHGAPVTLTAPGIDPSWSTTDTAGEALWAAPAASTATRGPLSATPIAIDLDGGSFA